MIKYELRYLPLFYDDLVENVNYIRYSLMNGAAADALIDAVETAIQKRLSCPESFEPYQSSRERKYNYYRIYVKNYVIYYVVIPGEVPIMEVRRMLYRRQDVDRNI